MGVFELQSSGKGLDNEVAVVLKAKNIEQARKSLAHVEKMVRRKTPVKFKTVDYKGYSIEYLSMKGLFKVLLGKFFARYDKPYYTIIDKFVVFSNHPQALESMIDDYLNKETLAKSEEFKEFRSQFETESSAWIYFNTPVFFNTLKKMMDVPTRASMEKNKVYIVCFRQVGFQLLPESGRFKTIFAEQFVGPPPSVVQAQVPDGNSIDQVDSVLALTEAQPEPDPVASEPADPMQLPYIYVQNLNSKSFKEYFADSTVHFEVSLKNGFKEGAFTEYYESGEKKMIGHFKQDKRQGTWHLYDENGKLKMKRNYDEGEVKKEKIRD